MKYQKDFGVDKDLKNEFVADEAEKLENLEKVDQIENDKNPELFQEI